MKSSSRPPRVLVVLANTNVCHRRYLEGILSYSRNVAERPWDVVLDLRDLSRGSAINPSEHEFDGVIAAIHNPAERAVYVKSGLPTVLFEPTVRRSRRRKRPSNVVTFLYDHFSEGVTAADYYLERGYEHFAYVGTAERTAWSDARQQGFLRRLARAGKSALVYPPPPRRLCGEFPTEAPRLTKWLSGLPHRTAVFVAHDERAQQVISCALHAGLEIPDSFAVLGVDNDELLCTTAMPTISSIPVDAKEMGYRFAQTLDDLLHGRPTDVGVRVSHTSVISRRSTEAFALPDPFLARALSYAAANLANRPRIDDLAREAHCSKRHLQIRALKVLGHPLKDELMRLQAKEAHRRLSLPTANVRDVAAACGFCTVAHMRQRLAAADLM